MRKWLMAALAGCSLLPISGAAHGADLPVRRAAPAYKAPAFVPVTNPWSGLYAGINAGYGWEKFRSDPEISTGDGAFGVQVGYNWLPSNWLFGLEGDIQTTTGHVGTTSGTCGGVACDLSARINGFGTVRGRIGAVFGPTLVYATGGAAFISTGAQMFVPGASTEEKGVWRTGYAVGAGVEQMLWGRWSGKLEYLYLAADGPSLTAGGVTESFDAREHLIRVGLNYHF